MSRAAIGAAFLSSVCAGCGLLLDLEGDGRDAGDVGADARAVRDDAGMTDSGASDGGADGGGATDAGAIDGGVIPPPPATIARTVSRQALPAIEWTGTDFVVALLAVEDAASGSSIPELHRFWPGDVTRRAPPLAFRSAGAERSSTTVGVRGTEVAVAWIEQGPATVEGEVVGAAGVTPMATIPGIDESPDLRDVLLFQQGGDWHAVVRRRDAGSEFRMWHVPLGPDAMTTLPGAPFSETGIIEMDRVEGSGFVAVVGGGVGLLYRFDGTDWSVWSAASSTITPNECGVALRPGAGLWLLCSDSPADSDVTARQLWLADVGATLETERAVDGWLGPDPAIAGHASGAAAAWVYEPIVDERSLGLGVIDLDGAPSPPCVVPSEAGYGYVNDPDIACGGGWCAVVWIEGVDQTSSDFIVRLAQFPKHDPSHLCR